MPKKKKFIITLSAIALVLALGVGLSLLYFRQTKAMTEEEARAHAAGYLPEGIHFVTADDVGDEFELIYFDDSLGRTYRVEITKPDGTLHSLVAQSVMAQEGSEIKIQSAKIEAILESEFPSAILGNYSFVEGSDTGLGTIELSFDWEGYNGTMYLNPETGQVLSFRLKRSAHVVIPVGPNNENTRFLSDEEAVLQAGKIIGDAKILDLELELEDDRYVYEIYASDSEYVYVLSLDAETGERIRLKSTSRSRIAPPTGETLPTTAATTLNTDESNPGSESVTETSSSTAATTSTSAAATPTPTVVPTTAPTTAATTAAPTTVATTLPAPTAAPTAAPTTTKPTSPPQAVITLPTNDDDWDDIVKYAPQISRERAVDIALARIPGAGTNHVKDIDLDEDDGVVAWEIELEYQGREYEVSVHAHNGNVLQFDVDD